MDLLLGYRVRTHSIIKREKYEFILYSRYRGQNLAGTIFTHSIPFLREAGIHQYLLEVLQNNEKAIAVY